MAHLKEQNNFATPLIFNPEGSDQTSDRQIWGGNPTNLIQLNDIKYLWGTQIYKQMREQFWIPQKIDITQDVTDYNNLTASEKVAYNGILSYLTFLDSIQTTNIPFLRERITAPEISICLAEQNSQEAMHNASYQYIIETIVPSKERSKIYDFWRSDKLLFERCKFIGNLYQKYIDRPTPENYFIALIADYILEGLYFYHGFIFFYSLASRGLMMGSADIFRLINRDELSHVRLFQKLIVEAMRIFVHSKDQVYELFKQSVEHEIIWSQHITQNILGITEGSIDTYIKYLANTRLISIGLTPLYEGIAKSPYDHLEKFSDTKKEGHTKANFFEATVTSYTMSSSLSNWDF